MTATPAIDGNRCGRPSRFDPAQVGWRIGVGHQPRSGALWCPWDRTAGVIGPQGSGKTLDLLTPALINAPGAALVTLTKVDDLQVSLRIGTDDVVAGSDRDPTRLTELPDEDPDDVAQAQAVTADAT